MSATWASSPPIGKPPCPRRRHRLFHQILFPQAFVDQAVTCWSAMSLASEPGDPSSAHAASVNRLQTSAGGSEFLRAERRSRLGLWRFCCASLSFSRFLCAVRVLSTWRRSMRRISTGCILALSLTSSVFAQTTRPADQPIKAVLLEGVGGMHHPVTTKNEEAQKFFDQGINLLYAFNHDESMRSFIKAAEL